MSYNCPKCHCGCLFEERGKLICLNCGAEVSKSAAEGVRHVHTYTTYRGKTPGKRQSVPKKPAPKATVPRPADVFRTADSWESASRTSTGGSSSSAFRSAGSPPAYSQNRAYQKPSGGAAARKPQKKRSLGCLIAVIVVVLLLVILPFLFEMISSISHSSPEPESESVFSESYEDTEWGVAYWYGYDGALPDELSEKLDTLIYGYNDDHDLPQAEDVAAYLEENLSPEELEGYYYECEQEGNDVCVTFYEEGSSAGEPLDWGVAYWYCTDDEDLPGDLATTLSDLLFEYNIDHDLPQAEEVSAYLEENLGSEFDGYSYTCEQEGNNVCVTFFTTGS